MMVSGSTCRASLRTPRSKSRIWPVCYGSRKGFQRGKKGWSKGESRDVLKFSTKEAGRGARPENYKQVRLKLQSDPLDTGWTDMPAHTTSSETSFSGYGLQRLLHRLSSKTIVVLISPLVNSPETKRLLEIAIADGASVRTACKTVRKRMRIEARRQKELDGGIEPEVVLDSFLNQVKVEEHPQSGLLKRVLTPTAKAAKHRRAMERQGVSRRRLVQLQACGG